MDPNKDIRKCIYQQMNNIFIEWDIISFLKINDIPYSNNNNGIFINISLLSDEITYKLYQYLQENISNELLNDQYEDKIPMDISNKKDKETKSQSDNYKNYEDLELTKFQEKLLSLS